MSKNKQYEKVLTVLLAANGNTVTKTELETTLANEIKVQRLSTYIWELTKKLGANVEVNKNGKNVMGYTLKNPEKFKNFKPSGETAGAQTVKAAMAKETEAKPVVSGEVASHVVDPDFDNFNIDDIIGK